MPRTIHSYTSFSHTATRFVVLPFYAIENIQSFYVGFVIPVCTSSTLQCNTNCNKQNSVRRNKTFLSLISQ